MFAGSDFTFQKCMPSSLLIHKSRSGILGYICICLYKVKEVCFAINLSLTSQNGTVFTYLFSDTPSKAPDIYVWSRNQKNKSHEICHWFRKNTPDKPSQSAISLSKLRGSSWGKMRERRDFPVRIWDLITFPSFSPRNWLLPRGPAGRSWWND